jgi:hypothetical protein
MPVSSSLRLYAKSLALVFRVILFEKFSLLLSLFWCFLFLLTALLSGFAALWFFAAVLAAALLLYRPFLRYALGKKYLLIRCGDRVEYALPDEEGAQTQSFGQATVLRSLSPQNAARTELFDAEQLELYDHFFLVDAGKKNRLIPCEWIIAIETGELQI